MLLTPVVASAQANGSDSILTALLTQLVQMLEQELSLLEQEGVHNPIPPASSLLSTSQATSSEAAPQEYVDRDFEFLLSYPATWELSTNSNSDIGSCSGTGEQDCSGVVTFGNAGQYDDVVSVIEIASSSVTTDSAKWGAVTYWYDNTQHQWMERYHSDYDGSPIIAPANPIFYTAAGLPVFAGSSSWKTDIVALTMTKWLVINSGVSGETDYLDPFVRSVALFQTNT